MADLTSSYPTDELIARLAQLGMTVDSNDQKAIAALTLSLGDAYDLVVNYCHNDFTDENGNVTLPSSVKKAIALIIKIDGVGNSRLGVTKESIAGMSKSFAADSDRYDAAYEWLKRYRRIGFIPLRRHHRHDFGVQ